MRVGHALALVALALGSPAGGAVVTERHRDVALVGRDFPRYGTTSAPWRGYYYRTGQRRRRRLARGRAS